LHVQPDAPVEIIKSSYHTLMLKLEQHPDLGGTEENASLINEAKEVLTDPVKRAVYDRELLAVYTKSVLAGGQYCVPAKKRTKSGKGSDYEPLIKFYCNFCKNPHSGDAYLQPDTKCMQCGSPLYPAVKLELEKSCQRAVKRIKQHRTLTFYTNWPQKRGFFGRAVDLSPNGMRFHTNKPLMTDQIIKVVSVVLEATARVAACRKQRHKSGGDFYAVGIEFLSMQFLHPSGTFVSVTV